MNQSKDLLACKHLVIMLVRNHLFPSVSRFYLHCTRVSFSHWRLPENKLHLSKKLRAGAQAVAAGTSGRYCVGISFLGLAGGSGWELWGLFTTIYYDNLNLLCQALFHSLNEPEYRRAGTRMTDLGRSGTSSFSRPGTFLRSCPVLLSPNSHRRVWDRAVWSCTTNQLRSRGPGSVWESGLRCR